MKKLLFLLFFLFLMTVRLNAQEQTTTIKEYLVPACIYEGDTIPSLCMPTLYVFKPLIFKNKKKEKTLKKERSKKEKMIIAVFDCDGFSIKGQTTRYPAEFVSEEYIYPEGCDQNCEDMGEEQDKFALAVILFKLLNNGIHPFSGTPRKQTDEMLSIQERIENYNYAYGLWPDSYQSPHPYSMHEYFDPKTLKLFDRAFFKNNKRPSAREWVEHIDELFNQVKVCKHDPNHIYFTAKGCGLCAFAEKVKQRLKEEKDKSQMPAKIRGLDISELSSEKNNMLKIKKQKEFIKLNKIALAFIFFYFLLFGMLSYFLTPFKETITSYGYFAQLLVVAFLTKATFFIVDKTAPKLPLLKNQIWINMLKFYGIITILVAFIIINDLTVNFLALTK